MNDVQVIKTFNYNERLKRVCGYARVSTADEHQDSSYKLQVEELESSIRTTPGYQFIGVFKDRKSGRDTKHRQEFNTMIELALMGEIDVIVTKSITRFARNILDSISIIRELRLNNVEVFFQKENISTLDPSIEMVLTILSMHAEEEITNMSENALWSIRRKIRKGGNLTSYLYGYNINGEDWTINPDEAKIVRMLFDMYVNEKSYKSMVDKLYRMGVKSPTGNDKWNTGSIESMVQNEKYAGHMLLCKTYVINGSRVRSKKIPNNDLFIYNHHKPIITQDVFDRALDLRKSRSRNKYKFETYLPLNKRVTSYYQFIYSIQNEKYLKFVVERPKGLYEIPTLYCYNKERRNRVMITVKNLFAILNESLENLSKQINEISPIIFELINQNLSITEQKIKRADGDKIDLLNKKVSLIDGKKKYPSFIRAIKYFTNLDNIDDFKNYIKSVDIIDSDNLKIRLSLISDDSLDIPLFTSNINLRVGNGNKDITYSLFI